MGENTRLPVERISKKVQGGSEMKTAGFLRMLSIILAAILAALAGASALLNMQPVQAKAEESRLMPETISAGMDHTCGVKSDGALDCWGRDDYGQSTPYLYTFLPLVVKH